MKLKILANQRDVPYQSLLKVSLAERLEAERRLKRAGWDGPGLRAIPGPKIRTWGTRPPSLDTQP